MESKNETTSETQPEAWNKSLKCWRTSSTGPLCLCVETSGEIHLFPYGYLQHASFSSADGKDTIQIQFQDRVVLAKGRGLKPLCDALCKFSVEQIRTCPDKLTGFGNDEGMIEKIEVKEAVRGTNKGA
jgi:hypothetical protein